MPHVIDELDPGAPPRDLQALSARDTPAVWRGLCRDWPLVGAARRSDTALAQALAAMDRGTDTDVLLMPPAADGRVGYNEDFSGFNYQHFRVSVTEALARLAHHSRQQGPVPGIALQSAAIPDCLPGLTDTHRLPFMPPDIVPRLWVGNRVTTPAHFDEFHNVAVVVGGRRRFTVFPPEQGSNLYIGPLDFAPTGAAIGVAPLHAPDDPRFPRLKTAMAHAQVAELEPGDAIYLPPLWWHHVESLRPLNALVNYWWQPRPGDGREAGSALGCLLHGLLVFRGLPPAQRRAWQSLFEQFVFGDDAPTAHLPAHRRGPLGELDADQAERLRSRIRQYLQ